MIVIRLDAATPVPLELQSNGREFKLLEGLRVNIAARDSDLPLWIEVPAGYLTDLASIPPEVSLLGFEKLGKHSFAAIVHDWMFANQIGYELANAAFYEMLRTSGVPNWKAAVMAACCQAGGKSRYKKKSRPGGEKQ